MSAKNQRKQDNTMLNDYERLAMEVDLNEAIEEKLDTAKRTRSHLRIHSGLHIALGVLLLCLLLFEGTATVVVRTAVLDDVIKETTGYTKQELLEMTHGDAGAMILTAMTQNPVYVNESIAKAEFEDSQFGKSDITPDYLVSLIDALQKDIDEIKADSTISDADKSAAGSYSNTLDGIKDALNGKDGQNGQNGQNGKDGQNGRDGQNGKDGQNGRDGQGEKGEKGEQGEQGKPADQSQYKDYAMEIASIQNALANLDTVTKNDLSNSVATLQQQLNSLKNDGADKATVASLQAELDATKAALEGADASNKSALESQISTLGDSIKTAQATVDSTQDAALEALKALQTTDKTTIEAELKTTKTALEGNMNTMKASLEAAMAANASGLESKLNSGQSELTSSMQTMQGNFDRKANDLKDRQNDMIKTGETQTGRAVVIETNPDPTRDVIVITVNEPKPIPQVDGN